MERKEIGTIVAAVAVVAVVAAEAATCELRKS